MAATPLSRKRAWIQVAVATGLGAAIGGCGGESGTGGREISFRMELRGADRSAPFTTTAGWEVTLTSAWAHVGPLGLWEKPPPLARRGLPGRVWDVLVPSAHAHPGDQHFDGGRILADWADRAPLDLLDPTGLTVEAVPALEGTARSASLEYGPAPAGAATTLVGYSAWVAGEGVRGNERVRFAGGVRLEGLQAEASGIPVEVALAAGVTVRVTLDPARWVDGMELDALPTSADPRPIAEGSQPALAFRQGLRQPRAVGIAAR